MFSRVVAVLVIGSASVRFNATSAQAADPVWTPPVALSDAAIGSSSPHIVGFNGGLAAIWNTAFGGTDGFAASVSSDGTTWTAPVRVSTGTQSAEDADLIAYSGGLVAAWDAYTGADWIPQVSTSVDGITWTTPVTLSSVGDDGLNVRVTAFSGGLAASWVSNSGVPGVRVAYSATGAVWSPPITISTPGRNPNEATITSYAGGIGLAWTERDAGTKWTNVSVSPTGAVWVTTTLMTSPDNGSATIASTGAGLVVVWQFYTGIEQLGSAGSADGITWNTSTLASGPTSSNSASVFAYNSRVAAVWETRVAGIAQVQLATTSDGLTWSTPVQLSNGAQNAGSPRVTSYAGGFAAVWRQQGAGPGGLSSVFVSTSADGATWTTPLLLNAAGERGDDVVVASFGGGVAAAWSARGTGPSLVNLSLVRVAAPAAAALADTGVTPLAAGGAAVALLFAGALLLARQRAAKPV